MTEPRGGQCSHLIIWAVGEARRLRLQGNGADVTSPALDARPPQPHPSMQDGAEDMDGVVVDWQFVQVPAARDSSRPSTVDDVPLEAGSFDVATNVLDGQVVLQLAGELDCATAPRLRKAIDDLGDRTVATLVLDLTRLTFIDSSGLHEIVVALKRQREVGGELVLRDPSPSTRRVLEIIGLSRVLAIE